MEELTTNKHIKEVLVRARQLISEPEHWCQGTYAKDTDGKSVSVNSFEAVQFCSLGALQKATIEIFENLTSTYADACKIAQKIVDDNGGEFVGLGYFNDQVSHEKVLEIFDEAIERISKYEQSIEIE